MAHMPTETGVIDLIIEALVDLLTLHCKTNVATGDVSRGVMIKSGPRQAAPESVSILIHENDPDNPATWAHKPKRYSVPRSMGGPEDPQDDRDPLRISAGYSLVGGGSRYTRAFTIELEVFGNFISGVDIEREHSRRIAAVVENRILKALHEAGPKIGTSALIVDDFGESVVLGPFIGSQPIDQEEGESLIVRKLIRFWYQTSRSWSTSGW